MKPTKFDLLLPTGVVVVEASGDMWRYGLYPEEAREVSQAVYKRRREFTAGRNCARRALALLGIPPVPITVGLSREPIFPDGVSGSISHCDGYCAAAVAFTRTVGHVGIDAESNITISEELGPLILSKQEASAIDLLRADARCHFRMVAFSGKESFYKAFFAVAGQPLDFRDLDIQVFPETGTFSIRVLRSDVPSSFSGREFHGRFGFDANRVYTAVALLRS